MQFNTNMLLLNQFSSSHCYTHNRYLGRYPQIFSYNDIFSGTLITNATQLLVCGLKNTHKQRLFNGMGSVLHITIMFMSHFKSVKLKKYRYIQKAYNLETVVRIH